MVQRFWRGMAALAVLAAVFSSASWAFLRLLGLRLTQPAGTEQLLKLPTDFPSVWSVAVPSDTAGWWPPLLVLLVQLWLTGGMYGTLVRLNTGRPAGAPSFASDAFRSFARLLLWYIVWFLVTALAIGAEHALGAARMGVAVAVWVLRWVFLFSDVALVCEQQAGIREAVRRSVRAWLAGAVPSLPIAVGITLLTGVTAWLSTLLPATALWPLSVLYSWAALWLNHMLTARYLYHSHWLERETAAVQPSPSTPRPSAP